MIQITVMSITAVLSDYFSSIPKALSMMPRVVAETGNGENPEGGEGSTTTNTNTENTQANNGEKSGENSGIDVIETGEIESFDASVNDAVENNDN